MEDFELIIGIHSIVSALKNSQRSNFKIYMTEEGKQELLKKAQMSPSQLKSIPHEMLSGHRLQEVAKTYFKKLDLEFQRIPSQIFLITTPLESYDAAWLYDQVIQNKNLKILCLDQITDVHNGAAILRTASFYGVDIVILPSKKSFGLTPSFYRIASGATEFLNLVQVNSLPKTISKLKELEVTLIALTEHSPQPITDEILNSASNLCLVLGQEETGISNAVLRLIDYQLGLISKGEIKSLNVSVAAAIAMEKSFGKI
jgi:23S rRNA (guanosine2251-2'-O)-methyltransferase